MVSVVFGAWNQISVRLLFLSHPFGFAMKWKVYEKSKHHVGIRHIMEKSDRWNSLKKPSPETALPRNWQTKLMAIFPGNGQMDAFWIETSLKRQKIGDVFLTASIFWRHPPCAVTGLNSTFSNKYDGFRWSHRGVPNGTWVASAWEGMKEGYRWILQQY